MEQANILLALGGDGGNQVPKFGVTAAEIMILQAIHGSDAITEIEPLEEPATFGDGDDAEPRTDKQELARLSEVYRQARVDDGNGSHRLAVQMVFPVASAVPSKLSDLDIDESFYKPVKRAKPAAKAKTKTTVKETTTEEPVKAGKSSKSSKAEERAATEQIVPGDETKAFE